MTGTSQILFELLLFAVLFFESFFPLRLEPALTASSFWNYCNSRNWCIFLSEVVHFVFSSSPNQDCMSMGYPLQTLCMYLSRPAMIDDWKSWLPSVSLHKVRKQLLPIAKPFRNGPISNAPFTKLTSYEYTKLLEFTVDFYTVFPVLPTLRPNDRPWQTPPTAKETPRSLLMPIPTPAPYPSTPSLSTDPKTIQFQQKLTKICSLIFGELKMVENIRLGRLLFLF